MIGLHGLHLCLQNFDGLGMGGNLPAQGLIFSFQCLDLVAAEQRTDALGDVGRSGCRRTFQPLCLYLFFRPVEFFLRRFSLFLELPYLFGQFACLPFQFPVICSRCNMVN